MKICCLSDTHNRPPPWELMPEADVLIHAGDATNGGKSSEIRRHAATNAKPLLKELQ